MKIAIKITCFLLVIIFLFGITVSALRFKDYNGIRHMDTFYQQEKNSIDVLILGSSHAYVNIHPELLWEEYGYSAFNLTAAMQPVWQSYYNLVEALKTQTPKLIILEGYRLVQHYEYLDYSYTVKNLYGMRLSKNKIEAAKTFVEEDEFDSAIINFTNYHSRYTDLSEADFLPNYGEPAYEYHKGSVVYKTVYDKFEQPDICSFTRTPIALSKKTEEYYRKLLTLAAENNIPVLTVVAPYYVPNGEYRKFIYAKSISNEFGQTFVDCNDYYNDIGIDFGTDIMDSSSHLNLNGAKKFTKYLGEMLQMYNIPDHRGDPAYESWDLAAKAYHRLYDDGDMSLSDKPSEYVQQGLSNGDYDFVVTWNAPYNATEEFTDEARATLERLGITFEGGELQDGAWIVRSGEVIYGNTKREALKKAHQFDRQRDILISYGVPDVKDWVTQAEKNGSKQQIFYLIDDTGKVIAVEGLVIYTYDTWLGDHVNTYQYVVKK